VTDWDKDTGSGGTIRIRDTGDTVEFWFQAGYSSDWYNGLQFSWHANGNTTNKSINYPTGADWYKVGYVNITTSQTVTFTLETSTNISGIGGPASLSHSIDRDTVPSAPSTPTVSGIKDTSVAVSFKDGSNGGDAIDSRQIRYDNNSDASSPTIVSSDGSTTITGLSPGTTYYFWARTHNSVGWSSWSGRASAKTLSVPTAPSAPLLSSVTATTVDVNWTDNSNGGSAITAHQIGYGTSSSAPTTTVSASPPQVVTGLTPGTVYYFFVRAQNSTGWSAWSKATSVRTVAGVRVNVNGVWKLGVPYVNVGGVWKMAEAWTKSAGTWTRTI
jgi:hypothetical protein